MTTLPRALIIAPKHYTDELRSCYHTTRARITYQEEELLDAEHISETCAKLLKQHDYYIGLTDYAALLAAHLNHEKGNPSPSPTIMARLQDKYHSRQIQHAAGLYNGQYGRLKEATLTPEQLPIFVKPCRASMSYLAQKITTTAQLAALTKSQAYQQLATKNQRWKHLYRALNLPSELEATLDDCIYEPLLPHGTQITVDGYVHDGAVAFFGATKSVFEPNHLSFKRFDFPFIAHPRADALLKTHITKLITASGFDNSLFNVECIISENNHRIDIVEINTRPSGQFMQPIQLITGIHPLDSALDILSGRPTPSPPEATNHTTCSVCVLRRPTDAYVVHTPPRQCLKTLQKIADVRAYKPYAQPGERLSDHPNDSHSYRYAECTVLHAAATPISEYEPQLRSALTEQFTFSEKR